jgi:hypothetical protein
VRVQEFRDSISAAFQMAIDWSACVCNTEREAWRSRASLYRASFETAECSRASARDLDNFNLAREQLASLLEEPKQLPLPIQQQAPAVRGSSKSRAAKYNSSASRAVRLSRAARSAMRRGYF